jgi:hypothetical protein
MIVSGPSSSGKTHFILELIDNAQELFDIPPEKVFWCFGHRTALHEAMGKKNFNMIEGIPPDFNFVTPNSLVMLDDLMAQTADDARVTELFTQIAHHVPCFVIKTTQNLFHQGRQSRNHTLNTQYLVLFKNPGEQLQVSILERHMIPHSKHFLVKAFESATGNNKPHTYLFIDRHKLTADHIRVRANILPRQRPMIAYVDKRLHGGITTSKFLKTPHVTNPQQSTSWIFNAR